MSTSFFETRAYNGSIKNVVQFRKMRKTKIFAGPAQSNSIIPIYFVYLIWFRSAARHFFHQPQQANHHHFGWVLKWALFFFFWENATGAGRTWNCFCSWIWWRVSWLKSVTANHKNYQMRPTNEILHFRYLESRLAVCLFRTRIWHLFSTYFWLIIESSFAGLINFFPKMNAYPTST